MSSIQQQAQALIEDVQRQLADGDERLRTLGLDPERRLAMAAAMSAEQRAAAAAAVQADLAAVDQEVAEQAARLAHAQVAPSTPRRPRGFV
jgi:hypothetical protein